MFTGLLVSVLLIAIPIAAIAIVARRHRRSRRLRRRFGPEYDRATQEHGDTRRAESKLERRVRRVKRLHLRPVTVADQEMYWSEWAAVQRGFPDDPWLALGAADHLLVRVMVERGYPLTDFEQRVEDISVDHPEMVQDYRAAQAIVGRHEGGHPATEDLRWVMGVYRSIFEAMLTPTEQLPLQSIDVGGTGIDHRHAS